MDLLMDKPHGVHSLKAIAQSPQWGTWMNEWKALCHTRPITCHFTDMSFYADECSRYSDCHLHQVRHIWRLLSTESAATLVHAFVTSWIDYCNVVLVGALKSVTNKLQRVLNAAAWVVSGMKKFDRGLTQVLHADLHWLDVPECVKYKLCMMMHQCQDGTDPQYLAVNRALVSETASRQHIRSAASHQLTVQPQWCITYGSRAFRVAGLST